MAPDNVTGFREAGDWHNIINLRNFTTEDAEFHGGMFGGRGSRRGAETQRAQRKKFMERASRGGAKTQRARRGCLGEDYHAEAQRRKGRGEEVWEKNLTQRREGAKGAEEEI